MQNTLSVLARRLRLTCKTNKLPVRVSIVTALAMLPLLQLHAISSKKEMNQYVDVMNNNRLTVVSVKSPNTVFNNGQSLHGFGYDLMRNYAKSLNVQLDFKIVADDTTALQLVAEGKANMALTNASMQAIEKKSLNFFSATCGNLNSLEKHGLSSNINLVVSSATDPLAQTATGFTCKANDNGYIDQLASFYNHNTVDENSWEIIEQDLKKRMPIYRASFKREAQKYNMDWQFLAAMGYQESYLKPNSVSPTGVRGLMMLTNNTAKAMGVTDRNNPQQSIQGGAKYLDHLLEQYEDISYPDRAWYALVAYNMGPGALANVQTKVSKLGKNPNEWINIYSYMQTHQASNGKYKQAVQYVTRIRAYIEHIQSNDSSTIEV
ncbi:transglycosylase SLT domain-containing protein [Acinetobacter sp. B5B]|uniref:transglycosylase SLT domain-containing protein n=1 Tax=Acinetobacter baretiae TaxID=2605383 RepID=UPI0018C3278D|nr:transglycosylase SLT domain-containing protein [Acinetobacter baretiae]MBF7682091.1 transglycosylase SLT domain-containing protein [Acinetobacter baretiae]MBF7684669.1 transglycosylase SLT domain-containing protein [Acinetobacter baretiae]